MYNPKQHMQELIDYLDVVQERETKELWRAYLAGEVALTKMEIDEIRADAKELGFKLTKKEGQ